MARDITKLHPDLQVKVAELIALCAKNGIKIAISECVRTTAEQDALYAKGRTAPGSIVTNARGSSYSSMHQWGVAFDFYLLMDVDHDGSTSDDAFNNATGLFNKVGALGKSIGLEWGGDWKSIKDLPHFQLPNWGSTTTKLRSTYGSPSAFMKTWKASSKPAATIVKNEVSTSKSPKTPASVNKTVVDAASAKKSSYAGTYKVTSDLRLRSGAGSNKPIITVIPKGEEVTCYGYYTSVNKKIWYFVSYGKRTGFVSADYCKKKK